MHLAHPVLIALFFAAATASGISNVIFYSTNAPTCPLALLVAVFALYRAMTPLAWYLHKSSSTPPSTRMDLLQPTISCPDWVTVRHEDQLFSQEYAP